MSIINSITNLVDLNTTRYNRKLRTMRRDTKQATKDIGQSFASIGTAWKSAIAGIGAIAISGAITKELQATEKSVAAFISATGGIREARAQFEMLQQAARDTIQPFDSLKAVTLDLRRNGIQATAETLKTFSQIAYGTGQSIETVGSAFTAALQGRYKTLNQLGIIAKQNGDNLILTYKGVTTEITKDAASLGAYFQKIGKENEGVLDYLQRGVTGALNHLENAWGDFYRAIGESGIGEMITDSIRGVATALDAITEKLKSPEWAANLEAVRGAFASMADAVIGIMKQAGDAWDGFISSFEDAAEDGTSAAAEYFNNFFKLVGIGISGLFASLKELVGLLGRAGEAIGRALSPDQRRALMNAEWKEKVKLNPELTNNAAEYEKFIKNYNVKRWDNHSLLGDISDAAADAGKNISDAIDLAAKNAADAAVKRAKENALASGLGNAGGPITGPAAGGGKTTGGKAGGSAARTERDSWLKYQDEIQRIRESGYTKLQQLREQYNQRIAELTEAYKQSQIATETDLLNAKAVIEEDYTRRYKELEKEAQEFLREIRGDELEKLRADYETKLEMLTEYHNSQLISEAEFLAARDKLQKDFEKDSKKIKSENGSLFSKETQEDLKAFTSGLDEVSGALSGVTSGMEKSSGAYKAMFAVQKSFSIASAMLSCINAWANALGDLPWPANLAAYAQAIAMTGALMGQLTSVTMHDKGGTIPTGGVGIVGEYGPELVQGPARVTSRRQTAEMARQAMTGGDVIVNLYESQERAGQVDQTQDADGERVINIFVSNIRRGGQIARTLESTYQVKRYGA